MSQADITAPGLARNPKAVVRPSVRVNTSTSTNALDQFYTKPTVAKRCLAIMQREARKLNIDLGEYWFIEPAAGCGCFYQLLPPRRRIGIDIAPGKLQNINNAGIIRADYMRWQPPQPNSRRRRYAIIGNPPFGVRGAAALGFINKSSAFADIVGFILPQLFDSDGKGVAGKRVRSYVKAYSEKLPGDSFLMPHGKNITVHTVFQIWTQINIHLVQLAPRPTCTRFISVYSLSDGGTPSSTRNKAMIGKCDLYLPSTCYAGMKAYASFAELPNNRGYGVVIHRDKREIKRLLKQHDWTTRAFMSTNSALNLRRSLIHDVLIEAGYHD